MQNETPTLEANSIKSLAEVVCRDCGDEGYTDIFLLSDGWYVEKEIECPVCGGFNITVILPRYRQLGL